MPLKLVGIRNNNKITMQLCIYTALSQSINQNNHANKCFASLETNIYIRRTVEQS